MAGAHCPPPPSRPPLPHVSSCPCLLMSPVSCLLSPHVPAHVSSCPCARPCTTWHSGLTLGAPAGAAAASSRRLSPAAHPGPRPHPPLATAVGRPGRGPAHTRTQAQSKCVPSAGRGPCLCAWEVRRGQAWVCRRAAHLVRASPKRSSIRGPQGVSAASAATDFAWQQFFSVPLF